MNIKKVLEEKGLSYQVVADRINANRQSTARKATTASISQMVNGEPSVKSLREMAEAIGCKVGDFFVDDFTPDNNFLVALIEYNGHTYSAHSFEELDKLITRIKK